jgi:hypothetical protein
VERELVFRGFPLDDSVKIQLEEDRLNRQDKYFPENG